MRSFLILVGTLVLMPGCTHLQLKRSTVKQASTLTDLQYQQVLDNLAMFACNPEALPWHVKLKGGTVQVTDLRGGAFGGIFGTGDAATTVTPAASAQRTVLGQWDVEPAIDSDDLEMLQLAYRKAVFPMDDKADEEIRFQMWILFVTYDFAPGATTLLDIMKDAVIFRFQDMNTELAKVSFENVLEPGVLTAVQTHLDNAKEQFLALIEAQRTENLPRSRDLVSLVEYLETIPSSRPEGLAPASPKETEYAGQFDHHVRKLIGELDEAERQLQPIKASHEQIKHISQLIYHMNDQESLRAAIQRLNPVRRREIARAKFGKLAALTAAALSYDALAGNATREHDESGPFPGQEKFLSLILSRKYLIPPVKGLAPRNPGLSDQAQAKVDKLKDLVDPDSPLLTPWFGVGGKQDVPKCACYVGHYCGCGCDCYVWVMPEGLKTLREFTLIIQTLASLEKQDTFAGRGAAFSPGLH